MKRETKKFFAFILTSALVLTSAVFPTGMSSAADPSKAVFSAADGQNYELEVTYSSATLTITSISGTIQNLGFFDDSDNASTKDFTADVDLVVNETYTFAKIGSGLTCAQKFMNGLPNIWGEKGERATTDGAILYNTGSAIELRVGESEEVTAITSLTYKFTFKNWSGPGSETPEPEDETPDSDTTASPSPIPDNDGGGTVTQNPKPSPNPGTTTTVKMKKVSLSKVKATKKTVTVQWKKLSGVTGYEVQIATQKNFKKDLKKYTVKKAKTVKKTIKKLKSKKKYYVRVRAYTTVSGKKNTGSWSNVKSVKVK